MKEKVKGWKIKTKWVKKAEGGGRKAIGVCEVEASGMKYSAAECGGEGNYYDE